MGLGWSVDQASDSSGCMQIENQAEFDDFMRHYEEEGEDLEMPPLKDCIATLWADPAITAAWEERNKFQIIESHQRFVVIACQILVANSARVATAT